MSLYEDIEKRNTSLRKIELRIQILKATNLVKHHLSTSAVNRADACELIDLLKCEHLDTQTRFDNLSKNANYTSKASQKLFKPFDLRSLIHEQNVKEVNESGGVYSIIADEARDNSCIEKCLSA